MEMRVAHNRLDQIYNSEIINLRNVKIASNQAAVVEHVTLYENADTSPFQRKEDVVLTLLLEGQINSNYQGINNQFQVRSRNCTFVYGPNDNEHELQGTQHIDSMAIGINKRFFEEILQDNDPWMEGIVNKIEKKQPFSFSKHPYKLTADMYLVLKKIRNTKYADNSMNTLYLQGLLSELLLQQFKEIKTSEHASYYLEIKDADIKKIQELKLYIDNHYLEEFTLDSLARLSGLNTFKIKTGFKALYHKSVFEYVRGKRMDYASMLLLAGGNTISEVAYILGYQHVQHFSTAFKKHFGVTPTKFKF
jgi:AraC family transcriptional regulator, transcriptional activator of the genes for pyochelin and ferripyochelin receptors